MNTNCRRRIRSTIKWGGAAVTLLVLLLWLGSALFQVGVLYRNVLYNVGSGTLLVAKTVRSNPPKHYYVSRNLNGWRWWFMIEPVFMMPLWFPSLLTATPTLIMWWHDRKPLAGTCSKCGYSRTGLPADRACPECGAPVPGAKDQASHS
jgi:hypothetical protein